jgi:hypothetical protein
VGEEMTCPGSTFLSMIVPAMGARISVSFNAMRAFSTLTWPATT